MKKNLLVFTFTALFLISSAFALDVNSLENLTPVQKQKISQVQHKYKVENDAIEQKIITYNSKIAEIKKDVTKSPSEIDMLTSAYQKNIDTLKTEQKNLEETTDSSYKTILTEEQYNSWKTQQLNTQNAFQNFLKK